MPKPSKPAPGIRELDTSSLIPNPRNAKKHDDVQIAKIAGSIKEFGFGAPIITDGENGILAGHGRWLAAQKLGLPKVPCVEMGHLTETQRRAYMLADNRLAEIGGGWDMDALRIELDDLAAEEIDLDALGFGDDFEINLSDDEKRKEEISDDYTHKVAAPVYEPKGEKPPIAELLNRDRADELISDIKKANLPKEVSSFLEQAAGRHVIFDYGKIAEFYCHADKDTQRLMEDSALVVIDFKKAMQLGYVKLKQEIADALESEQEWEEDE